MRPATKKLPCSARVIVVPSAELALPVRASVRKAVIIDDAVLWTRLPPDIPPPFILRVRAEIVRRPYLPSCDGRREASKGPTAVGSQACLRGIPLAQFHLRSGDDGLCATFDSKLLQDGGHMRLYSRFRNIEFICNLLVEQPIRQHHQDADLLWRQ